MSEERKNHGRGEDPAGSEDGGTCGGEYSDEEIEKMLENLDYIKDKHFCCK
ncbi:MAG: hypothetical protein ACTSUE_14380 [Promethearchaeota archaeon]